MTKAELVDLITGATGMNRRDTVTVVNLIMENIGNALAGGDKVELRGFGSFKVRAGVPAWLAIRAPVMRWTCRPSGFPISRPRMN